METPERLKLADGLNKITLIDLLRPHSGVLLLAFLAVAGEIAANLLEPWPLKVVIDYVVQSKTMPGWLAPLVRHLADDSRFATLNLAVASVVVIALIGALSSYTEKYLTTSVGQWVTHDLRRTLYYHIHRLSLSQHDKTRVGDLISRVTSDIEAIQTFITTALLGVLVSSLTLVGIIAVMFYLNARFTLLALSIAPLLFGVVYTTREGSRKPLARCGKRKASCIRG